MKYFLDTNVLIDLINKEDRAIELLNKILRQDDSKIYIDRLVEMEFLRTVTKKQEQNKNLYTRRKEILRAFEKLEITPKIYSEAIEFSRFCVSKGFNIKGKCAAIDYLHFITAKEYGLKLIAFDDDMAKLEENYEEFNSQR